MKRSNRKEIIHLNEFYNLSSIKQYEEVEKVLKNMYGNSNINNSYIKKVLEICFNEEEKTVTLPDKLELVKKENDIVFEFHNANNLSIFLYFLLAFLISGIIFFCFLNTSDYENSIKSNQRESIEISTKQ